MSDEQPKIQLPAMLDVVQPNGAKVCPIMGPQIIQMPVNQGSVLAPGQGHTVAFVRQFSPCVKAGCMLWDVVAEGCLLGTVSHQGIALLMRENNK